MWTSFPRRTKLWIGAVLFVVGLFALSDPVAHLVLDDSSNSRTSSQVSEESTDSASSTRVRETVRGIVVFVVVVLTAFGILAVPLAVNYRRRRRSLDQALGEPPI